VSLSPRLARLTTVGGLAIFLCSLLGAPPPSFAPPGPDRELLLSGRAAAYWEEVKPLLGAQDRILPVADAATARLHFGEVPFSLLGAYNYASLFEIPSWSGYNTTASGLNEFDGARPHHWSGLYAPSDVERLLNRHPQLKIVQLRRLRPLRIEMRDEKSSTTLRTMP
jgi:hypothetical protein